MFRFTVAVILFAAAPVLADPPQRDAAEKASDSADKVICKRFEKTGSLIGGERVCKTKADWERDRANLRALATTSGSCASAQSGVCQ